jgi:glycosyltransferase involved in cell wall biosynthesis
MKVLVSAFHCSPYAGSENYIGWSAVQCLARDHDLWVLTSGRNRPEVERARAEGLVPANTCFFYANRFREWHPNRMKARLQSWTEYRDYSRDILALARTLHQSVHFDLVHHVTVATWRVASPLWQLGIPFVFGPIGGHTNCPLRLLPSLSPAAAGFELLRTASNLVSRISPSVRACVRNAAHIFTPDAETGALMVRMRGSTRGVSSLSHAFFSEATIQAFAGHGQARQPDGPLRIFAGGNLIGTKGVSLALWALARVKKAGVKFRYRLGTNGPEVAHLKRLAARLDLSHDVLFADDLHGEDYRRELGVTHVFLLPSLRESAGLTMMEAMLSGCVPIVADCGGPGIIVTGDCGYKIPVISRKQMVDQITETIMAIDRDRKIILEKGRAASQRITTGFSEDAYRRILNETYGLVTKQFREQNDSR